MTSKQDNIDAMKYLCVELEVRARSVHDDLLRDAALIADPQRAADDAAQLTRGNHARRLQHLLHQFSVWVGFSFEGSSLCDSKRAAAMDGRYRVWRW